MTETIPRAKGKTISCYRSVSSFSKKKLPRTLKSHFAAGTPREFFERRDRSGAKLFHRGKIGDEEVGGSARKVRLSPRRKLIPSGRKYRLRFRLPRTFVFARLEENSPARKAMDVAPKFL